MTTITQPSSQALKAYNEFQVLLELAFEKGRELNDKNVRKITPVLTGKLRDSWMSAVKWIDDETIVSTGYYTAEYAKFVRSRKWHGGTRYKLPMYRALEYLETDLADRIVRQIKPLAKVIIELELELEV